MTHGGQKKDKERGRQRYVLIIASAADGIRLAAGNGTDDVCDRVALHANIKPFDDSADSK
jgi:hypothetical protein